MKVFSSDVTVEILYRVYGLLHGPALHVPSFSIGLIKTDKKDKKELDKKLDKKELFFVKLSEKFKF